MIMKYKAGVKNIIQAYPHNRLLNIFQKNVVLLIIVPLHAIIFQEDGMPVPSSPACNANCVGCISFQPEEESIVSTQDRLTFKPTAEEIVEFTVPHLETAPFPIVSFGQGCEGEPLLMWETIRESIIEMRKHTDKGSININTNGSKPAAVRALCEAGLNSIRVSTKFAEKMFTKAITD
jgi:MoaA/NifB/PqqE/SkfB family radical SAM enzyme